uniref:Uncharacterized protein n=1 Tax=Arundo donax TaxID=35708 RepID=A0A0A9CBM5_ARUDO
MCSEKWLIEMYAQYGCFTSAHLVFDGLKEAHVLSWTVIMSKYAKTDECEKVARKQKAY